MAAGYDAAPDSRHAAPVIAGHTSSEAKAGPESLDSAAAYDGLETTALEADVQVWPTGMWRCSFTDLFKTVSYEGYQTLTKALSELVRSSPVIHPLILS